MPPQNLYCMSWNDLMNMEEVIDGGFIKGFIREFSDMSVEDL